MRAIIVDDEELMIKSFLRLSEGIANLEVAGAFTDPEEALLYVENNPVEALFCDIEMPDINGIELARKVQALRPGIIIVFVSAYEDYIRDANDIDADYYILKPYRKKTLENFMEKAMLLLRRQTKRVKISAFGEFEVFVDDRPLVFPTKKSKELMALLVDRFGAKTNQRDAFHTIWEDKPYTNNNAGIYRKTKKALIELFSGVGEPSVILSFPHDIAINTAAVSCDYFDFLNGDPDAVKAFSGTYMNQYSWAEETCGKLYSIKYGSR